MALVIIEGLGVPEDPSVPFSHYKFGNFYNLKKVKIRQEKSPGPAGQPKRGCVLLSG